jgi:hypothetical protein
MGMCDAQVEELELLLDLFRENPEDFWRSDKNCATDWNEAKFLQAINDCRLIPRADPNTPWHIHRLMRLKLALRDRPGQPGPLRQARGAQGRARRRRLVEPGALLRTYPTAGWRPRGPSLSARKDQVWSYCEGNPRLLWGGSATSEAHVNKERNSHCGRYKPFPPGEVAGAF